MSADYTPPPLEVGAPCVVFQSHGHRAGTASLVFTTIDRIGKRDVVTASGHRFNVARLSSSTGTWSPTSYLLDPAAPVVARARQANAHARRVAALRRAMEDADSRLRCDPPDITAAVRVLREACDGSLG